MVLVQCKRGAIQTSDLFMSDGAYRTGQEEEGDPERYYLTYYFTELNQNALLGVEGLYLRTATSGWVLSAPAKVARKLTDPPFYNGYLEPIIKLAEELITELAAAGVWVSFIDKPLGGPEDSASVIYVELHFYGLSRRVHASTKIQKLVARFNQLCEEQDERLATALPATT